MENVRGVQPQHVVEILKREGIIITEEQAKLILDFMYQLANIALDVYENHEKTLAKDR